MTNPELDAIFQEYAQLAAQADQLFERVKNQFPEEVACASGCSSCCHAAFDLSLVEAMALNRAFNKEFDFGIRRSAVLQAASDADRQLARLKRHYFQQARQGMSDDEIMVRLPGKESAVLCWALTTRACFMNIAPLPAGFTAYLLPYTARPMSAESVTSKRDRRIQRLLLTAYRIVWPT